MNACDERNEIIKELLPQLIKNLTNFEDDDENLRRCEQFAWSHIRNPRYLSTNSHHVKRKIEGIKDKFLSENCAEYAEHLAQLCQQVAQHPLCVQHYEVDVHWSLLDLLLSLAYNPGPALRRNKHKLVLNYELGVKQVHDEKPNTRYWENLLKQDFIPAQALDASDSDLSNWSDSSSSSAAVAEVQQHVTSTSEEDSKVIPRSIMPAFKNIKPPQKILPYSLFDTGTAGTQLLQTVQHSWWLDGKQQLSIESQHKEANSAQLFVQYMRESTANMLPIDEPIQSTEYCLLRELIWMFQAPQNCKFFQVEDEKIRLRELVTIPSANALSIFSFLEEHFLPHLEMAHTMRSFTKSYFQNDAAAARQPKTLDCYAANLRMLLQPFWQALLEYEQRLILQQDFDLHTLISFQQEMLQPFQLLSTLHAVHQRVVLRLPCIPAHICSAYLLTSLLQQHQLATSTMEANLIMSLFLTAVKVFCSIIDTWWTEGRLDDWQQEFIVERLNQSSQVVRLYSKDKEKSFFVASNVSEVINGSAFFQLLYEYALEAGNTLNLLYEINRIGDMRNNCMDHETTLYDEFVNDVMKHVQQLHMETLRAEKIAANEGRLIDEIDNIEIIDAVPARNVTETVQNKTSDEQENILKCLSTTDTFLLQAFAMEPFDTTAAAVELPEQDVCDTTVNYGNLNALEIFEHLQQSSQRRLLPLQELILNTLRRLLKTRIAFANVYVLQLYHEDFQLLRHQQHLRRVLLLEASDLMHQFYEKLFKDIETGSTWANPIQLTTQLDDILSSKFPDMSSLFRVEIKSLYRCQTAKVADAVEELSISYNFNMELSHFFNVEDIEHYNTVLRFLLKVKWALHALEQLYFATASKRRPAYAQTEYIDLLMRRLQQLRFWMLYAIQSIHFHLMTHVLQAMGDQLDDKLKQCRNFKQMKNLHAAYLRTVCEHCFLTPNFKAIKWGIEEFLSLVNALRLEWNYCVKYIENLHPLALYNSDDSSSESEDYIFITQIDAIEVTYIKCHQYLANMLNNEVYLNRHAFLSGLSAAFNTSLPH